MNTLDIKSASNPFLVDASQELDRVADAALYAARLLMEAGAPATVVHEECSRVARGLGAEHVDLRSGYASLDITISRGMSSVTRMLEVGALGVNYRLAHAIRRSAQRIWRGGITPAEAQSEMTRLKQDTERHAPWVVALAVGIACASFGRLLGMDWAAFIPVAGSGAIGQSVRHSLLQRGANVFVVASSVAFLASSLGQLGARWAGSTTLDLAMIASVLLLVPGVPALNGQRDILEGHPTLGAARAVVVAMILIFIATGVLIARALLGIWR
jgi:uncharacterized membrane protein YjjP (DUF1212 family)